jgi:hypothetical protein
MGIVYICIFESTLSSVGMISESGFSTGIGESLVEIGWGAVSGEAILMSEGSTLGGC